MKVKRRQRKRRIEKTGISFDDVRKFDKLYLNAPASFERAKRLQNLSKLSMKKIKKYLETKPSINKYRSCRLRFPRLKVVKVVDCLSRYLRVEPLKTKYATETAQVFEKMVNHTEPEKVWVDDGTDFLGAFKALCTERGIHLCSTFSEESLLLRKEIYARWQI